MNANRRELLLGSGALSAMPVVGLHAQSRSEVELTRSLIQAQRQELVADAMDLTADEEKKFWPLYREYRGEMAKIGDRVVQLIMDYAEAYRDNKVTDANATTMLDEHLKLEEAKLGTRKKYLKPFREILPGAKVTRFYQIENKLDTVVNMDLVREIPLMEKS